MKCQILRYITVTNKCIFNNIKFIAAYKLKETVGYVITVVPEGLRCHKSITELY